MYVEALVGLMLDMTERKQRPLFGYGFSLMPPPKIDDVEMLD